MGGESGKSLRCRRRLSSSETKSTSMKTSAGLSCGRVKSQRQRMFLFRLVSILQGISCSYSDKSQTTGDPAVMVWGFIIIRKLFLSS